MAQKASVVPPGGLQGPGHCGSRTASPLSEDLALATIPHAIAKSSLRRVNITPSPRRILRVQSPVFVSLDEINE